MTQMCDKYNCNKGKMVSSIHINNNPNTFMHLAIDSMVSSSYRIEHIVLLSLFTFEMLFKILSFGMIDHITPNQIPFFRHPNHIFDFLVNIISWVTLLKFDITCSALRIVFILCFIPILEMTMQV